VKPLVAGYFVPVPVQNISVAKPFVAKALKLAAILIEEGYRFAVTFQGNTWIRNQLSLNANSFIVFNDQVLYLPWAYRDEKQPNVFS
jgi:hypothetical protein